jgi:hypothetical protein
MHQLILKTFEERLYSHSPSPQLTSRGQESVGIHANSPGSHKTTRSTASVEAESFYAPFSKKAIRQGDIALCEFHQLRSAGGEPPGPGPDALANEDLPYLGPYRDYPLTVTRPESGAKVDRVLRVWTGFGMIIHQNCELEYADQNDSRVLVAPIVSKSMWSLGSWDLIAKSQLPGFFHLPPLSKTEADAFEVGAEWPESAVAFASTTLLSRGIVKPNRVLGLAPRTIGRLQELLVRFATVRGWGSHDTLKRLVGYTVKDVHATSETVPGPASLAKVILEREGEPEEITVAWGVRRSGRPVDG